MKKLFLLLALLGIVATGCSKDEGGRENNIPENIFFGIDKESVTFSPDGGSVDVIVYSNYKWEISGVSDWCTPSLKNGGANEDGQKVTFSADVAYDDREATFWFRCADEKIKFVVSQRLKEVIIPDANNTFNIPAEGGVAVISYQTSVDCEVIIPEEAQDWITIAPATRGLVSENINLDIVENTTYSARTAVIKVVAKDNAELAVEYTINQEQNDTILADENNTFTVPSMGGEVVINYQTNIDCDIIIPEDAQDWIAIIPETRGLVAKSAILQISENTTYSARTAVVKVVAKDNAELVVEYTINQVQNDAILADENNTFTVPSTGGEVVINYQANVDCDVIIPEEAQDWITIAPATRGLVSENINLDIAENTTYSARTAVIKVVAKDNAELVVEYTINQEQKNAVLANGNTEFTIDGREQQITIEHKANVDCDVIIPDEAQDWVTIAPATRGLSTYSTTLNIAENNSVEERSCVIKVTSQGDNELFAEYTIVQNPIRSIYYTSSDGKIVTPYDSSAFGATIVSNTYIDGVGVIEFNAPITTIGNSAFDGCVSLTSVTIPDSVTSIGGGAFHNCSSLTSITIPDSVTTIGVAAFMICDSLQEFKSKFASEDGRCLIIDGVLNSFAIGCGATEYTIPDSVTTIGAGAFGECYSLTSVTIPDSVTTIREYAFACCSSLTSVTIPDSVTTIGYYAFYGCSSLTSVTIGDSVTSIGDNAFNGCSSLTSVTIGDSVTSIGDNAFIWCESLTRVYISDISAWCNISFRDSSSNPLSNGCNLYLNNELVTDLIIPDSVTSIGNYAFCGCSGLTSVTIPDSVTTIGERAFEYCESLTSVTIGDSVTTIGNYAFEGCSNLTSVTIPDSVTTIGYGAFALCSNLQEYNGKFASEDGRCLIIDGTLNSFAPAGLTEYPIPDSVTTIGDNAFFCCFSLTSVTIGDSVTTIGQGAFSICDSLTSVTIPDSVTTIGQGAFYQCHSLTSVYCKATTPPVAIIYYDYDGYWYAFDNNASGRKIYVPMESVEAYKSASGWSEYASAIVGYNF